MTTLLSSGTSQIYEKINLFSEYDPTQYQSDSQYSWISNTTLEAYLTQCTEILRERYDDIVGGLSSIDKDDDTSIQLAEEKIAADTFEMEPSDLTEYLANGLSFENAFTHDLFTDTVVLSSVDMIVSDGGNSLQFVFSASITNPEVHPYPMDRVEIDITMDMARNGGDRYDYSDSNCVIQFYDLYRGPMDNIGDRGDNYYVPTDAVFNGELPGLSTTFRFLNSGGTWSFNTPAQAFDYTLDIGSSGVLNINFLWTVSDPASIITVDSDVDINGSTVDFNGSILMAQYQWSEFTSSQSPNILREIESLNSTAEEPQNDLFVSSLIDSVTDIWDEVIDALPNGENFSSTDIIAALEIDLNSSKAIAKAENIESIKKIAKTYLANQTFIEGANYALSELGITTEAKIDMTAEELSDLNNELIDAGITDFEESDGYYNWANVPEANSMDVCSRFSIAIFDRVKDFSEMETHPSIQWISNNFDYLESELINAQNELDKVI